MAFSAGNVGPFAAGADTAILDSMWQRFFSVFFRDGVLANQLNQMAVAAGAGLAVTVDTGLAVVSGIWCYNDALFSIALATADPTNPRIDNIVIHVNRTSTTDGAGVAAFSAQMIALTGTPAGSPVVTAVTQNANTWEISLNNVRVNANAIVPSTFTDTRIFGPNWPLTYQQSGVGFPGYCGGQATATAIAQVWGWIADFGPQMQKAPTSITLTTVTATNANTQTASAIKVTGFLFTANAPAAGLIVATDTYATVGNCLRRVHAAAFDIHCDGCEADPTLRKVALKRGRSLYGDLQVLEPSQSSAPGLLAVRHECPDCGLVECFNTALSRADEGAYVPGWEQRMEQAALIRDAQERLKLPMLA